MKRTKKPRKKKKKKTKTKKNCRNLARWEALVLGGLAVALPPALGGIAHFGVGVALVCVAEPGSTFFFATHQRHPILTRMTMALPNVWVAVHLPHALGLDKLLASSSTNAVREQLVVPEGRVLENQPTAGLADSAPTFTLVPVATHPPGGVQVAGEAEVLLVGDHVGVVGVHVLFRRRDGVFQEASVQIRALGKLGVGILGMVLRLHVEQAAQVVLRLVRSKRAHWLGTRGGFGRQVRSGRGSVGMGMDMSMAVAMSVGVSVAMSMGASVMSMSMSVVNWRRVMRMWLDLQLRVQAQVAGSGPPLLDVR